MVGQKAFEFIDPNITLVQRYIELSLGLSIETTRLREREQQQCDHCFKTTVFCRNDHLMSSNDDDHMMYFENKSLMIEQLKAFALMSCVIAKDNGPQQKLLTGFQWKNMKNEICIVCCCHCKVFTVDEFLKHANNQLQED